MPSGRVRPRPDTVTHRRYPISARLPKVLLVSPTRQAVGHPGIGAPPSSLALALHLGAYGPRHAVRVVQAVPVHRRRCHCSFQRFMTNTIDNPLASTKILRSPRPPPTPTPPRKHTHTWRWPCTSPVWATRTSPNRYIAPTASSNGNSSDWTPSPYATPTRWCRADPYSTQLNESNEVRPCAAVHPPCLDV